MSKPRTRPANSVTLFPFLAVLVCAMGALIFLLLITTQKIQSDKLAQVQVRRDPKREPPRAQPEIEPAVRPEPVEAAEPPPRHLPEPAFPATPPEFVTDGELARKIARIEERNAEIRARRKANREETARLRAVWEKRLAELQRDKRNKRDALRMHNSKLAKVARDIRESEEELQRISKRRAALHARFAERRANVRELENEQRRVNEQLANAEGRLRRVRQALSERKSEYAFVPFDGANGTTRRPIVLECTDRSIRFVSEDIALAPQDLNGFIAEYNPVLAGARALMTYWEKHGEEAPYVLLVVRPRGSIAFYVARQMLAPLEESFGYELVEEDFRLHAPQTEPEAAAACRAAIESALSQRSRVAQQVRHSFPGSVKQLRLREGASTFDFEEPSGSPGRGVTASDALLGRRTSASDRFFSSRSFQDRRDESKRPGGRSSKSSQEGARGTVPRSDAGTARGPHQTSRRPSASESFLARTKRDRPDAPGAASPRSRVDGPDGNATSSTTGAAPDFKGRRWGQSPPGATIGFERDVTIEADADGFLVGGRRRVLIDEGEKLETLTGKVVGALDAHARDWGRPPAGFYWIPSVKFVVYPGGNAHFERVGRRLAELGLQTRVKHALEKPRRQARGGR